MSSECLVEGTIFEEAGEEMFVEGPTCSCYDQGGGARDVGPIGLGCFEWGRAGDCLWDDSDYTPCEAGDPGACEAICDELAARRQADYERAFDARVRHTQCIDSYCRAVIEVEGACYVDHGYQRGASYDCNLTDREILESALGVDLSAYPSCDPEDLIESTDADGDAGLEGDGGVRDEVCFDD